MAESNMLPEGKVSRSLVGGSLLEGIGGLVVIVLALIGLAKVLPTPWDSIATIVIGFVLLFNAGFIGSRLSALLPRVGKGWVEACELRTGVTAEFLGGLVGIILGVIAFSGLYAEVLIPVATLLFGLVLVLDVGVPLRLNAFQGGEGADITGSEAVWFASFVQLIVGLGAMVLAILALAGVQPLMLSLIGLLCIGVATFCTGAALSGRMMKAFSH